MEDDEIDVNDPEHKEFMEEASDSWEEADEDHE